MPCNSGLSDTIPSGLLLTAHGLWLLALADLDSNTWVSEVKRIRGKKQPLPAVAEGTAVRSVMDLDILGQIFEQSITDLERLRKNLETRDGARTYQFKENRRLPYQFLLPAARAIALCWCRSLCSA